MNGAKRPRYDANGPKGGFGGAGRGATRNW